MTRFAAIDVGSNALRLKVVDAPEIDGPPEQLALILAEPATDVASMRSAVRLGAGTFQSGRIDAKTMDEVCTALLQFRAAMDAENVVKYRATATSALREAKNAEALVERVRRETGIDLEIISGAEEARLIQLAIRRRVDLGAAKALLVDVGGGSTEMTRVENGEPIASMSMPLGTVRLLGMFPSAKDTEQQSRQIRRAVKEAFRGVTKDMAVAGALVLASGGNSETLAEHCASEAPISGDYKLRGNARLKRIGVAKLKELCGELATMTAAEREKKYKLRSDRADTIYPAACIYAEAASLVGAKEILVPGSGLRDGVLEELILKHRHVWDERLDDALILRQCNDVGAKYHADLEHARLVCDLASQLFDVTRDVHRLVPRDRTLLRAASLLHDIGSFLHRDAHHKHSQYIIQNTDIMGFSDEERTVTANVARYHRKSPPSLDHPSFRELAREDRARVRALASLLRLADGLSHAFGGRGEIVDMTLDRGRGRLVFSVARPQGGEWSAVLRADMMRDVLGIDVLARTSVPPP